MKIKSIYGSLFGADQTRRTDMRYAPHFRFRTEGPVDRERLQQALDRACRVCPYVTYDMEDEDGICCYTENTRPMDVLAKRPERLGTEENHGHLVCVCAAEDWIDIFFSHAVTDGKGYIHFMRALLQYYFGLEHLPFYDGYGKEDYFADLMLEPLTVSEDYSFRDYRISPVFRIPEAGVYADPGAIRKAASVPSYHIRGQIDLAGMDRFCAAYHCSHTIALFYMLALTVCRIHPENQEAVTARCPVDCRRFFGAERSFQNASMPQIILDVTPADLADRTADEIIPALKARMKEQIRPDHLAYTTNQYAAYVKKEGDCSHIRELLGQMGQSFLISDFGEYMPTEVGDRLRDVDVDVYTGVPVSWYIATLGDRIEVFLEQVFENRVYPEELVRVMAGFGIEMKLPEDGRGI